MNDALPFITVMMPAYNEEAYIRESLLSLISTGYPQNRMEIIVADGQSRDRTREEVAKVTEQYSFVRLINNPEKLQSAGCNRAAAEALPQSEYFIRVDAHSKWSENFLPLCIQTAKETRADLVVFVNAPVGITPFQKALAYALQHPLGVGNSLYRLGKHSGWVDHGQHGCFTREIWKKTQGYSLIPGLRANEDVELSFRVANQSGKIWLNQKLRMSYFPRKNIVQLATQYFHYGIGRFTNHQVSKKALSWRQLIPPFFIGATIAGLLLSVIGVIWPLLSIYTVYITLILIVVVKAIINQRNLFCCFLLCIFPVIHFFWGLGFLGALCKNIKVHFRILSV
jgi:succinoglycan biosynthesis protein ExoA